MVAGLAAMANTREGDTKELLTHGSALQDTPVENGEAPEAHTPGNGTQAELKLDAAQKCLRLGNCLETVTKRGLWEPVMCP